MTAKPDPATGPIEPPRVTSIQATVRAGRHGWIVGWLPTEGGWFCQPHGLTKPCNDSRHCEHITAVRDAMTRSTKGGDA